MVLSPVIVGRPVQHVLPCPAGAVDQVLSPFGLSELLVACPIRGQRGVVILALVWASFGFGMVVILSAMTTVDTALYDAAAIDGASWWRRLRSITIPMISGSLQFLA